MPIAAGVGEADVSAVPHLVGNEQDLGEVGVQEVAEHVDFERPEAAAEGHLLRGRQRLLVAEDDDGIAVEGVADGPELILRQVVREVEAQDFGPEHRVQRTNIDQNGLHGAPPPGFMTARRLARRRGRRRGGYRCQGPCQECARVRPAAADSS